MVSNEGISRGKSIAVANCGWRVISDRAGQTICVAAGDRVSACLLTSGNESGGYYARINRETPRNRSCSLRVGGAPWKRPTSSPSQPNDFYLLRNSAVTKASGITALDHLYIHIHTYIYIYYIHAIRHVQTRVHGPVCSNDARSCSSTRERTGTHSLYHTRTNNLSFFPVARSFSFCRLNESFRMAIAVFLANSSSPCRDEAILYAWKCPTSWA